jgi:ornithine cyclodeaminase/alanine dehydrogenase-like protein (mu-crystallin family)
MLILDAAAVDRLLEPAQCITAVETAFRERGIGRKGPTGVLGVHAVGGGFHVKAAATHDFRYFAAKINANFPGNPEAHGLPTIQGTVTLFDGQTGRPLAILDTVRITALRTAAASAVAASYLSPADASSLALVGCGTQAAAHLSAFRAVRPVRQVRLFDSSPERAEGLARAARKEGLAATVAATLRDATRHADLVVTCTPSREPILDVGDVSPGAFVAAVGADHAHKQEIAPALMARSKVVVDLLEQCVEMGDLRGAIAAGTMTRDEVHAELGDVVAGRRPGRTGHGEIFVFDSTGVAFEDLAAAAVVYERARNSPG